ncbi:MAG: alpha/beta fold hydrolase [Candidatus Omnitrophota bacterium]|nr:alpha/beta fold hydrolase [Candidatus Omnitrophota bacterium]
MENPIKFKNNSNLILAGILNSPVESSNAGIILLHGFAGNKEENGLFPYAANILSANGYHTLRFDFAGVGESQGDYSKSTLNSQKEDFISSLDFFVKKCHLSRVGVVGFSLGATIALLGYEKKIKAMALWSPALFPKKDMFPRYQTNEFKRHLKGYGYINKGGLKVGSEIIDDLGKCDLIPFIRRVECEVLLIHGDRDERINYKSTLRAERKFLKAQTYIIKNSGHSYKESYLVKEEVLNKTIELFNRNILHKVPAKNLV